MTRSWRRIGAGRIVQESGKLRRRSAPAGGSRPGQHDLKYPALERAAARVSAKVYLLFARLFMVHRQTAAVLLTIVAGLGLHACSRQTAPAADAAPRALTLDEFNARVAQ